MEQVKQLKDMRDDAWSRIKSTADYKLATSLDALISDLETALAADGPSDGTGDGNSDDEESDTDAPFESDPVPPLNVAGDSRQGESEATDEAHESEQSSESLLASAKGGDGDETEKSDEDVMSELTQMIHAGFSDNTDENENAREGEPEAADELENELAEQDAIMQAMKALDEDLSASRFGQERDGEEAAEAKENRAGKKR